MPRRTDLRLLVAVAGVAAAASCTPMGSATAPSSPPSAFGTRSTGDRRPVLAIVEREGDARAALAIAASTEGIAPDRGALAGVALGAMVEARMAAHGFTSNATAGAAGWRLSGLVETPAAAAAWIDAARAAMLTPVAPGDPALAAVERKASALAHLSPTAASLADAARCGGEAFAAGPSAAPTAAEIEAWRAAADGLGRIAVSVAGSAAVVDAATGALARGAAWPTAAPIAAPPWPASSARAVTYDASGELSPGAARITVVAVTARPERAISAASMLGDARGPLASRLSALDPPAHLASVVGTAHPFGGCLVATIDLAARDLASDAPARIATAAVLAREESAVELSDAPAPDDLRASITSAAADPRDAAERAAWWSLSGPRADVPRDAVALSLVVAAAERRDATEASANRSESIRAEIDRATLAWHAPVVDARTRVERGQGEVWIVVGSPCGTLPEASTDAGAGAVVAVAAAAHAAELAPDAHAEPFVGVDGLGVIVHGAARPGENAVAQARRLADAAARAFAADRLDETRVAHARSQLLVEASSGSARALGAVAAAVAPGHPSWLVPSGTAFGHASASDDAIAMRAAAVRAGPLRVAVLANADAAQAEAAVRAVDRWIARRPGEARACPVPPAIAPPKAGTYAVDRTPGAPSEALLALPLPAGDEAARRGAAWLASALDGDEGLLAHALGADPGASSEGILAQQASAAVMGGPRAAALVVRLVAPDESLDGAVAQTRALLDRLRQGALREEDLRRATASRAALRLTTTLNPRDRAMSLWRGESPDAPPTLEAERALAASILRDESLIVVAARSPRVETAAPRANAHDPRAR